MNSLASVELKTSAPRRARIGENFWRHTPFIGVLFVGFMIRYLFSDAQSYWLDELYSVVVYGIDNATAWEAINKLKDSVHPPLYQFVLYHWMALFGDSEVATRTLSNLYIAGAALCLYSLTQRLYGIRLALVAVIAFSFMYVPVYYALETRSYAQTIFLSSLSSLLLYKFLKSLPEQVSWRVLLYDWRLLFLIGANFALLMTHYYNLFFLGAQGAFLLTYFVLKGGIDRGLAAKVVQSVAITTAPVILLLSTWGPVMAASYATYAKKGNYAAAIPTEYPLRIFLDAVARPNLHYPALVLSVMALLLLPRLVRSGKKISWGKTQSSNYFDFYFFAVAVLPCVLAFGLFLLAGHERYSSRYFAFCTPPLAILLVLSLQELVRLLDRITAGAGFHLPRYTLPLLAGALVLLVTLPRGFVAATQPKANWRDVAKEIATLDATLPGGTVIYETTFRDYPTLNYYLARFSTRARVFATIRRWQERKDKLPFTKQAEEIRHRSYLILAFPSHRAHDFPNTLAYLERKYTLQFSALNSKSHGFLLYKTAPKED